MSKIFDGTYTRLDDDVSFQLVRTNPMLTTNTKLVYDGENMYLESYDANPLLTTQKYKNKKVKGTSPYNRDIRNFLLGTKESAYDVFQKESDLSICDSYDKQFETMYWCGAESINSKQYPQELGFIAPLYIRKKLPNYFVIFKIDGPSNFNLTLDEVGVVKDNTFDFYSDIFSKAKIIKSFDLREGTPIGNYIKRYVEQSGFEYDKSVYVNFSSSEITYYGIDKKYGVLTSKTESFRHELLENDNTIMHSDDWITSGFKRNNLIFPYIINFEFLFDDNDTRDYNFARYFGMYCNDIDLYDFEAKYKRGSLIVDKPEDLLKKTIVKSRVRLIFNNNEELRQYDFDNINNDKYSFYYVKDKNDGLHQVSQVYTNPELNDTSIIEITDNEFDLSSVCGFENTGVAAYCERINTVAKSEFSFTVKRKFTQGEQIRLKYNDEIYKTYTAVNEDEYVVLPGEDYTPPEHIEPGKFRGTKFSALGTINDMVKALCDCINSSRDDGHFFDALYKDNVVVVRCVFSGESIQPNLDVEFDDSLVSDGKIIVHGKTNDVETGTYTKGSSFKIKTEEIKLFGKERYLKTGNLEKKNAKILSLFPYVNKKDKVEPEYFELVTDENGLYVNVSNTNMVEIVDRFYPKFGVLSFFPVMDFDFDFIFSRYGYFKTFKKECEELEKNSSNVEGYERGKITTLAEGYLKDYNGRGVDTEYEYFMENLVPELSTISKSVPYITKWGYYDDEKDSCENPYRLNMSKIFGTSNLSSNTFTYLYSVNEHTHSMPYYVTRKEEMCKNGNYQYVLDTIGIYNFESHTNNCMKMYNEFLEYCKGLFMDTEVDNFDKLLSYKTDDNKRFVKKYSRMKFGDDDRFASTLFRGVKFNIKKVIDEKDMKGIDYNDYKFSFLYIPIELTSVYISNRVYFVKNDTFKFIIGFVIVNTFSNLTAGDGENYLVPSYDIDDFCKAYIYGGCYGLLSLPYQQQQSVNGTQISITNIPIEDLFNLKKDDNNWMNVSKMSVSNQSIKKMIDNLNKHDCILSINIHNDEDVDSYAISYTFNEVTTYDGVVEIQTGNPMVYYEPGGMFVDITFKNIVENGEPLIFKDFYDVFESLSTYNIKENINDDFIIQNGVIKNNVLYFSTSGDKYKMEIEDPVSFNTYDVFTSTPQIVPESGLSIPICSDITLKSNVNDISLKTINRYSGYYNPIFNEVLVFDDFVNPVDTEESEDLMKTYKYSNTKFDTDYKDVYGSFGMIKNLWFHKVNEFNPDRIIRMMNPFYPAIGEFALDYRDYNIFESNWDKDYFTTQVDNKTEERNAGTVGTLNKPSMFGSKYVNVPEEIRIECFNGCGKWDDDFITHPDAIKEDIMYKEINGNTVNFYLFLNKRIVRYFAEESGLKNVFEKYVNPKLSFGDKTTIDDDVVSYIEKNIMGIYYLDSIDMWVKETKSNIHDKRIENDYNTYLPFKDSVKIRRNMKKVNKFSIKKMTEDLFDRHISYNLKTGRKEDFGFSITIKKI